MDRNCEIVKTEKQWKGVGLNAREVVLVTVRGIEVEATIEVPIKLARSYRIGRWVGIRALLQR